MSNFANALPRRCRNHHPYVPTAACLIGQLLGSAILPTRGLAADLQTGNMTALNEQVDYVRLRRSFAEQIIGAYLRITGRASKLGSLEAALGASIVDPWLSQIVNPENLAELLRGGAVSSDLGPVSFRLADLPSSLNTAWNGWLSSEYGLGRFSIGLPLGVTATDQF